MAGIIINLPYTAAAVPSPLAKRLGLSAEDWQLEHWRLTDPYLAQIVREAAVYEGRDGEVIRPVVIYPFSPVVADPWGLWAAELNGDQGALPPGPAILPRTTAGRAINWTPKDRELIFGRTVEPFYRQIEEAAGALLEDSPLILVLTLRSYGSNPLVFEKCKKYPRPQVAVGSTAGLTPDGLVNLAGDTFRAFRWWPELNWPHGGGACLPPPLAGHPRVRSMTLSLGRDLYMDERSGRLKDSSESVARILRTVFNLLDQELGRVAEARISRNLRARKKSPIIKANR